MKQQPTIVQYNTHYGTGDIYASQGVDTRVSLDPVLGWLAFGGAVLGAGYIAVQAVIAAAAVVVAAVPYVLGAGSAAAAGIIWVKASLKAWEARQKLTPPRQILTLSPQALEMAARLKDRGVNLTDEDLQACERLAQRINECETLSLPR
jgi:hypothetical protein